MMKNKNFDTPENSYGFNKRFIIIADHLQKKQPKLVLDFGCGTGRNLTSPLAEQFPFVDFVGLDNDNNSILYANQKNRFPNLVFMNTDQLPADMLFDLIICSEVIEHLENPDRSLIYLYNKLSPDGILILTLPNGYGPFEVASFFQTILEVFRIIPFLRWAKRKIIPSKRGPADKDTFASSPHINYFSYNQIVKLQKETGFYILDQRQRTFLCGLFFDQILFSKKLIEFNQEIADRLPPWMNSGWMFVLGKTGSINTSYRYKRNAISRVRKFLNKLA